MPDSGKCQDKKHGGTVPGGQGIGGQMTTNARGRLEEALHQEKDVTGDTSEPEQGLQIGLIVLYEG